jgi:hypothetical protein
MNLYVLLLKEWIYIHGVGARWFDEEWIYIHGVGARWFDEEWIYIHGVGARWFDATGQLVSAPALAQKHHALAALLQRSSTPPARMVAGTCGGKTLEQQIDLPYYFCFSMSHVPDLHKSIHLKFDKTYKK